jgi:hypothetical protein
MATNDTEHVQPKPPAPEPEPAPPIISPGPAGPVLQPATPQLDPADALRAEYAEIAEIATQAGRLGVAIDAADAMRKGIKPEALRRTILDALATHAEASSVIALAPVPKAAGESPIVRRARERAAASHKWVTHARSHPIADPRRLAQIRIERQLLPRDRDAQIRHELRTRFRAR